MNKEELLELSSSSIGNIDQDSTKKGNLSASDVVVV
jgi:hypothetical protein